MKIPVSFILILVICFLLSSFRISFAGKEIETEEIKQETGTSLWSELAEGFDYTIRFIAFTEYLDVSKSTQNPDNDFFRLPRYVTQGELRPDFRLIFRRLDFSIKPRLNVRWDIWEDGSMDGESDVDDDLFINEWLGRLQLSENLFLSYGRENLQWGPSFLFSPSNPFFRDNGRNNPKKEIPGMDFARLVWLPDFSWSISLLANLDKGEQDFLFYDFEKSYALKVDYNGQESYAGMILSYQEKDRTKLGFFAGLTATDALLLYGEGSISKGTNVLYPVETNNPFSVSMEAENDKLSSLDGVFLAGGSYTLEAGPTLTLEYLYNGAGYNDSQAERFYQLRERASVNYQHLGLGNGLSQQMLSRTADPKMRFLRKNYLMLQYSHNDIWDVLSLTFRLVRNIDDSSGQFISIIEYLMGDHIELFSIGSINTGSQDTEFRTVVDAQWMIGIEYTF